MIWQFGELGYDYSINYCENGTISDACRTNPKPILWDYLQTITRQRVYDIITSLNKLRFHPWYKDVFIANNVDIQRNMTADFKWMTLRSAVDSSDICIVGNFGVVERTASVTFPVAGTWYDYLKGSTFTATGAQQNLTLQPGEYHVYVNRNLTNAVVTSLPVINTSINEMSAYVYPNPAEKTSMLEIEMAENGKMDIFIINMHGQQLVKFNAGILTRGKHRIPLTDKINNLPAGTYLIRLATVHQTVPVKLVIP